MREPPGRLRCYSIMKKTIGLFLLAAAVFIISVAAYTERVYQPREGYRAPSFELAGLADTAQTVKLSDLKGQYVLLSFWSAADPISRMRNMTNDMIVRKVDSRLAGTSKDTINFISVNFDSSRRLVEEIASRDSLNLNDILLAAGPASRRLRTDYHLADGYRSYLIDPTGRVIARNPSEITILELMR